MHRSIDIAEAASRFTSSGRWQLFLPGKWWAFLPSQNTVKSLPIEMGLGESQRSGTLVSWKWKLLVWRWNCASFLQLFFSKYCGTDCWKLTAGRFTFCHTTVEGNAWILSVPAESRHLGTGKPARGLSVFHDGVYEASESLSPELCLYPNVMSVFWLLRTKWSWFCVLCM